MISPNIGGTALPICKFLLVLLPKKIKSSGKLCILAPSLVDNALFWNGCMHREEDGVPKFLVIVGDGFEGSILAYTLLK